MMFCSRTCEDPVNIYHRCHSFHKLNVPVGTVVTDVPFDEDITVETVRFAAN